MAAAAKTVAELNSILGGTGTVDLAEATIAFAGATGLAMFAKKIGLWPKLSPVERKELEMLDADMPEGWFRRTRDLISANALIGKRFRWRHGDKTPTNSGWSVGQDDSGNLTVTTPILDEASDSLV